MLDRTKLSSQGVIMISDAIAGLQQPIEMIDLSGNFFNVEAAASLAKAMHNIKKLGTYGDELAALTVKLVLDRKEPLPQRGNSTIWSTITSTKIVNRFYDDITPSDESIIETLIHLIKKALKFDDVEEAYEDDEDDDIIFKAYFVVEIAEVLTRLASNEKNNAMIVKNGFLECLLKMMTIDEEYHLVALKVLWALALDDDNAREIETFENGKIMELLQNVSKSQSSNLREATNRLIEAIKPPKQKPQPIKDGHVMISYQWDSQPIMLKARDKLQEAKLNVWMDVDEMRGSLSDQHASMAEALEQASIVLMCVSQKYRDSHNCRLEGKYANKLGKPIIPIMVQDDYKGDGWLGLLVVDKLYYDLSNDEKFEENFPNLLKILLEKKY